MNQGQTVAEARHVFGPWSMLVSADGPCDYIEDHPGVITRPWPVDPDEGFHLITERCETCGKQWGSHRTVMVQFVEAS